MIVVAETKEKREEWLSAWAAAERLAVARHPQHGSSSIQLDGNEKRHPEPEPEPEPDEELVWTDPGT